MPHPPSTSSIAVPAPSTSSISNGIPTKALFNSNPKPFYPTADLSHDPKEPKEDINVIRSNPNNFQETKEQKEKKTLKASAAAWKMTAEDNTQTSKIPSNNNLLQNLGINNLENKAPSGNFPPLHIANGQPLANIEQNKVEICNFDGAIKQENTFAVVGNVIGGGGGQKKRLVLNKNAKEFNVVNGENEKDKQQLPNNKIIQSEQEKESQLQMKLANEKQERQKLEEFGQDHLQDERFCGAVRGAIP